RARLVVQGWAQRHGLDCGTIFAPVGRLESQRLLLPISTAKNWPILALDVRTAFLNGKLQETVFCRQPPGFETLDPTTRKPHVIRSGGPSFEHVKLYDRHRVAKSSFFGTASDPCVYTKGVP
ncbi:unnamed protein product, partial [Sphacelaria rigidula]